MSGSRVVVCWAIIVVAVFLTISLRHLDTVPPVHEDEPWQASVGAKLATEGVFGSDLMGGFHGSERRFYGFMPVHSMLLSVVFRVAGIGLFQTRLETVLLGLAVLILTGVLTSRLFDGVVAVTAMVVLVMVPWLPMLPYRLTGIPLIDQARIARYDLGVGVFALGALLLFLSGSEGRSTWRFAAAGAMVGVAGLCNLYGFFMLPILIVLGPWNNERRGHLAALVIGLTVAVLPYVFYVLADLDAWAAQTYLFAPRFKLLTPGWYLDNLLAESHRYGELSLRALLQPGTLLLLIAVPGAVAVLLRRAWRDHDRAARAIVTPTIMLPIMLALLISTKQPGYLLIVVPFCAVTTAWAAVTLWRRRRWPLRSMLLAAGLVVAFDGAAALAALDRHARKTTPYPEFALELRRAIPDNSRVLALHRFWFGLEDLEVRSWWVPMALADPRTSPSVIDFGRSLDAFDPDIFLVDDEVRATFTGRPHLGDAFRAHLEDGGFVQLARVIDPTYGRIDVYGRSSGRSFGSPEAEDPRSR